MLGVLHRHALVSRPQQERPRLFYPLARTGLRLLVVRRLRLPVFVVAAFLVVVFFEEMLFAPPRRRPFDIATVTAFGLRPRFGARALAVSSRRCC